MDKINWINGQAGGTPLSAENLNQMQDNIENAINEVLNIATEKNIITASGASGEIATSSSGTKIALANSVSVGSKLTLTNDGGIIIGSGITKVAISASTTYTSSTASQHNIVIYKNSKSDANRVARMLFNCSSDVGIQATINIPYQLINVSENDVLYLYVSSSENKNVSGAMTFMTVEAVG